MEVQISLKELILLLCSPAKRTLFAVRYPLGVLEPSEVVSPILTRVFRLETDGEITIYRCMVE